MNEVNFFNTAIIFLTIILAAIEPVIAKLAYTQNITPIDLIIVKSIIGALFILPVTRCFKWVGLGNFFKLLFLSLLLLSTYFLTLSSLTHLSAVMVITILTTTPAIVGIINQALGKVRLNLKFWLGFGLCFGGIILGLNYGDIKYTLIGILQISLAVLSSTIYRIYLDKLTQDFEVRLISTYIFLINGLIILALFTPKLARLNIVSIEFGTWMGIIGVLANIAFLFSLRKLGSTQISVILMVERPIVLIIAALILKEALNLPAILGIVMVLFGIKLAKVETIKRENQT